MVSHFSIPVPENREWLLQEVVAGHSSVDTEPSCTERAPLIKEAYFLKAGYSDSRREGPRAQDSLMTGTSEALPTGQRKNLHVCTKKLQGKRGTLTRSQGPTKCHILALALALDLVVCESGWG